MRRRFHIPLLILVLLPLMALARWGGPARGPWGRAADGIQARLVCARSLWRDGDVIRLGLELRNVDDVPRSIGRESAIEVDAMREHRMFVRLTTSTGTGSGPLLIEPGEKVSLPLPDVATRAEGAGVYELWGTVGALALRPVKVRVLPARRAAR